MLDIYYQNVRGMRTKTEDIYKNILLTSYDVIAFTESWLNLNITNREFIDPLSTFSILSLAILMFVTGGNVTSSSHSLCDVICIDASLSTNQFSESFDVAAEKLQ